MASIDYIFTFSFALNLNLHHCFDFSCDIKEVLMRDHQVTIQTHKNSHLLKKTQNVTKLWFFQYDLRQRKKGMCLF